MFEEGVEHLVAAISQADESKPDTVVGANGSKGAQGSGCAGYTDGFGKVSSRPGVPARYLWVSPRRIKR
jgi:hypothetical protein